MDQRYRYFFTSVLLFLGLTAACLPSAAAPTVPPPPSTTTPVTLYAAGTHPVAERAGPASPPTAQATHQSPTTPPSCTAASSASPLAYNIQADVDYANKTVQVEQDISFTNTETNALDKLVFYVHPNKQPGIFHLETVSLPGITEPVQSTLEGVRLEIALDAPLQPDCTQEISLSYELTVPRMGIGHFPRQGYLGTSDRQFNLGFWLPVLAYYNDETWHTPVPINIGEQMVTPAADYHVTLTLKNAPDDLLVVGPGHMAQDGTTWEFTLPAARDFTLSMSTAYRQFIEQSEDVQVEVYTLDNTQTAGNAQTTTTLQNDAGTHTLAITAAALELFADLYGPYPYERLIVIESDFPDGMEFSGLVFVGGEWFRTYQGDPAGYLTLITVHEVAHQWWYNLVGNDQSTQPWLDEALAITSEYVFLQENYPDLTDWWWEFRVNGYFPQGAVDATVYEFNTVRGYINAVYLRGAQFLHAIRQEIGTEAFFQWLADYAANMRHQIAEPADLWQALPVNLQEATQEIRAQYLRNPEINN
ncbi:M1 family metallopeptidase [Chloroflexota bacterium]